MFGTWDLIRTVAEKGPVLLKLAAYYKRAGEGDPTALAYFKSREAILDVAQVLFPGREWMVQDILDRGTSLLELTKNLLAGNGQVLEGQFREPEAPWLGFVRRLRRQESGAHIIIGPRGSGKTTLAKKLARVWLDELGYTPEFVNLYGEDRPSWGVTILPETLVRRVEKLQAHLRAGAVADPDEKAAAPAEDPGLPPTERTVVVDEASLAFTRGAIDATRNAVYAVLGQCRHVRWHLVFIAQWTRMIPAEFFADATVWVKRPRGSEALFDRDNPAIVELWERAQDALEKVRTTSWWEPPHDRWEAWAYVSSPELGYQGVVPFTPPED